MSKKAFKHIPEQLQNAVIGFGGTLPGVGKTYTKKAWAEKLRALGYQVIETGSTNKASDLNKTIYSVAGWTDMEQTRKQKKFVRKTENLKIFNQRSAFIMIDEAWMLSQEDIETVKKQFPKCCILLFGDPNQFPPIDDNTVLKAYDNMSKDAYDKAIYEIRKAIKKGIKRNTIYSLDKMYNLTVQYRVKTPELKRFLDNIKQGFASEEDALVFMQKHQYKEDQEYDFAICRTWEGNNGVYAYGNYSVDNNKRTLKSLKKGVKGVYVGQTSGYTREGFSKNSLFQLNGKSFENETQITDTSIFRDEKKMHLQGAVTCHSIQGATLNTGTKVIVDIDDAMSLIDTEAKVEKQLYEDFARFMYIACSRVQSEDDIVFKCQDVEKFVKIMSQHVELSNSLGGVSSSSSELSSIEDPVSFLLETEELRNRKPATPRGVNSYCYLNTWLGRFRAMHNDFIILRYDIKNIYNSVSWNNANVKDKCKALHISPNTYCTYKTLVEKAAIEYFKTLEVKENVVTTGKTIGEIEEDMQKDEEINENLDNLVEIEIKKCISEKDQAMFREYWSKSPNRDTYEFIKDLIGKHYTK